LLCQTGTGQLQKKGGKGVYTEAGTVPLEEKGRKLWLYGDKNSFVHSSKSNPKKEGGVQRGRKLREGLVSTNGLETNQGKMGQKKGDSY